MGTLETVRAALRARLITLSKASVTGALSCSGSAFYRSSGDFVADGFRPGDDMQATGWGGIDGRYLIKNVSALSITTDGTLGTLGAATRSLSVPAPRDLAWSGFTFAPTPGRPYLRDKLAMPIVRGESIGPKARVRNEGTYFVDVFYPSGLGTAGVDGLSDAICDHFYAGLQLDRNGLHVHVIAASRDAERPDASWIFVPITVRFKVFTVNTN